MHKGLAQGEGDKAKEFEHPRHTERENVFTIYMKIKWNWPEDSMILENLVLHNHEGRELDPCLVDHDPYHVNMHADDQQALGEQLNGQSHVEAAQLEEEGGQRTSSDFLA